MAKCGVSPRGTNPGLRGACHRAALRADPLAPSGLLPRLDAEILGDPRDLGTLLLDRRTEFGRTSDVEDLPAVGEPRPDHGIGSGSAHIRGDTLAQLARHALRAEQAD